MAGACSSRAACERVGDGLPGAVVKNRAQAGYTAQQISDRYFAEYATACNGSECGTVVVQGIVNTLKTGDAVTGVVEQTGLTTMKAIVVHALQRGRRVVWVGPLPYASCDVATCPSLVDPGQRAATYNALMAAECTTLQRQYPRLRCIIPYDAFENPTDTNNDGVDDAPPDYLKTDFACSDGIHLQDSSGKTGPQTLAALILAAIAQMP
jgi:hypothetical protein